MQYLEDHSEFQSTNATAGSRISADRYMSPTAMLYRGNACAASHATHVAGLAAGLTYGAGKDATIVSGTVPALSMTASTPCTVVFLKAFHGIVHVLVIKVRLGCTCQLKKQLQPHRKQVKRRM